MTVTKVPPQKERLILVCEICNKPRINVVVEEYGGNIGYESFKNDIYICRHCRDRFDQSLQVVDNNEEFKSIAVEWFVKLGIDGKDKMPSIVNVAKDVAKNNGSSSSNNHKKLLLHQDNEDATTTTNTNDD